MQKRVFLLYARIRNIQNANIRINDAITPAADKIEIISAATDSLCFIVKNAVEKDNAVKTVVRNSAGTANAAAATGAE